MPLLWILTGAAGGLYVAKGTDGISNTVKWVVIGGGLFLAAKAMKVI